MGFTGDNMSTLNNKNASSRIRNAIMTQPKRRLRISWKELKKEYGGLIWVWPGIVGVHELSHIIVGKGLNMRYGWFGFTIVHKDIPEAMFGSIGVYVNEVTPWTFAAGLVGSLLWLVVMRKYRSIPGFQMTRQTFWAGLLLSVWIAKWDLKWLAGEILKVLVL